MKNSLAPVSAWQMKRLVNASKSFFLIVIKPKEKDVSDALASCGSSNKHELFDIISNYDGVFQEPKGLLPKREIEHEIYL